MNERRLRERLREEPIPDQRASEERSWEVLRTAFEERAGARGRSRLRPGRLAVALAAAALLAVALALTPAGAEVGEWIEDVIEPGREDARPALTSLPAAGRLLVESDRGPWIVQEDGSRRLLGDYEQATWSPSGLFVAVTHERELSAVDPVGNVRWSLSRQRVSDPSWAPSGFRVAYRSGDSLRVVAGDGSGDRLLAERVAPAAPAWRPQSEAALEASPSGVGTHELAYALPDGRIRVMDTDGEGALWTTDPGETPTELRWSPDGESLLALAPASIRVFERDGRLVDLREHPPGASFRTAAYAPDGDRYALVETLEAGTGRTRSEVHLIRGPARDDDRRLLVDPGTFTDLAWSPGGEWLLVAWREADQWLFIRPGDERAPAVANISRQFDPGGRGRAPFPRVEGWCCAP